MRLYMKLMYFSDLLNVLFISGMDHIVQDFVYTAAENENSPELFDYQYDCAWRLGQWDEKLNDETKSGNENFARGHSLSLKHFFANDFER